MATADHVIVLHVGGKVNPEDETGRQRFVQEELLPPHPPQRPLAENVSRACMEKYRSLGLLVTL